MPLLPSLIVCIVLALVFPKGFKYMVATWVGVAGGMCFWALTLTTMFAAGVDVTWPAMGWSAVGFVVAGMVVGCLALARD